MRLKTVRAKLIALVALSGIVLLFSMPVLFWALERQLVDQADDRIDQAEVAFRAEFHDSLAGLHLAATVMAASADTQQGIAARDPKTLTRLAHLFNESYPDLDVLFVGADGKVLAQVGCDHAPDDMSALPELEPVMKGATVRGPTRHGCEALDTAPPAYMIAKPVKGGGAVIVCLPINAAYLGNAGQKFGLKLALLATGSSLTPVERTSEFPDVAIPTVVDTKGLVTLSGEHWMVVRFEPKQLVGPKEKFAIVAALNVTGVYTIVRGNLLKILLVLSAAAAVSLWIGWRLASVMSRALTRVNFALKKLEKQEYVHVEAFRTGDELEDLATGFNSMVEGLKERDNLRTTFGKYMTASVMDHLLSGKVQLGGVSMKVTILFSDIRGFTSISEKMDAQALVGLLNEYLTEMVGIVGSEDGVVDKYIGDAIMAVFGAPVPKHDDAIRAVRAAVRMRQALVGLNERFKKRGTPQIRMGVGVHTGEVVAGNIGSEARMEYTVIGDAVNLASRLESNTKDLGVNILISEDTYLLTKDAIQSRLVREITVKGRAQPVRTYEVLGLAGEPALPLSEGMKARPALSVAPSVNDSKV